MNKTKIEWCDYTWNPVTGCRHNCPYCYARRIATRFQPKDKRVNDGPKLAVVADKTPFQYGFTPTLYPLRLEEPKKLKNPSRIFVVSMGDLFGEWVPDHWIKYAFDACIDAPQHTYMFLTKNPTRYSELAQKGLLVDKENFFYGSTATDSSMKRFVRPKGDNSKYSTFLSIEPLLSKWDFNPYGEFEDIQMVIVGAQTGPGAKLPPAGWIEDIINQCKLSGTPLFLKDNLKWYIKIQEFPGR